MRERQEIIGIACGGVIRSLRDTCGVVCRRREVGPPCELGAVPDRPARREIDMAVVVEIGEGTAFRHEPLRERLLVERAQRRSRRGLRGEGRRGERQDGRDDANAKAAVGTAEENDVSFHGDRIAECVERLREIE